MSSSVELIGVSKSYGALCAVRDLSLHVEPGEMLTLLGPSGCGKSTILNMVSGFTPPDHGQIIIGGEDMSHRPPHLRKLGVVFQNYALFPHMTVLGNVAFGLRMRGMGRRESGEQALKMLDVVRLKDLEDRKPSQLSGGQRQRVALARALVVDPMVLLLDEPLSALDKNLRTQMQIEIKDIQRRLGVTTIGVTHDQGEALSMSDRIAVVSKGVLQQVAAPNELYARPATRFVANFVGETNRLGATLMERLGNTCRVKLADDSVLIVQCGEGLDAAPGGSVDLFVRPEEIELVTHETDHPATVRDIRLQVGFADIEIDAAALGPMTIRTTRLASEQWRSGMSTNMTVRWESAYAFSPDG